MVAIGGLERLSDSVCGDLAAKGNRQMRKPHGELAVVAEGVALHMGQGPLVEAGREWASAQQELIGAAGIFNPGPQMIPAKLHRGLDQITVLDASVARAGASPQH